MIVLNLLKGIPRILNVLAQNLVHPTADSTHPLHQRLELFRYANYQTILAELRDFTRHYSSHHAVLERQYTQTVQIVYQQVVAVLW